MVFIADYALQSRWRALLLAAVSVSSLLFGWLGAAVVALITLRKGISSGAWLVMWAVLPAAALAYYTGDASSLCLLLGSFTLATILRVTVSLPLTLIACIAVGVLVGLAMHLFAQTQIAAISAGLEQTLASLNAQLSGQGNQALVVPNALQIAGMLGLFSAIGSLLCLLLARFWQASLFNPGGFGDEFHALRLSRGLAVGLLLTSVLLGAWQGGFSSWAMLLLLPLHVAGLAVVHAYTRQAGRGGVWLLAFYLLWLLLEPVKLLIVLLALVDSWFDLRQRFKNTGGIAS
ncbi:MAG: hypothetical protein CSA53_06725 [Gammaproteobacteria bacterium]|nr:MAG: hypothetical protein CSA53_06725 [Gammaproteobacteria bacterium]